MARPITVNTLYIVWVLTKIGIFLIKYDPSESHFIMLYNSTLKSQMTLSVNMGLHLLYSQKGVLPYFVTITPIGNTCPIF